MAAFLTLENVLLGVSIAVTVWIMLACTLLLPTMEHQRDYVAALKASALAIVLAVGLWCAIFVTALHFGWTTL